MKRWLMTLVVAGTACQTTTTTERTQTLTEDPCEAKLPPAPVWDGKYLAPTGPDEMQIVVASPFVQGEMLAARVNYVTGKIVAAFRLTAQTQGPFYAYAGRYGRLVVPGTPPIPPDVVAPVLVFSATRYADVPHEALADAQACSL
jgi:hypothetical protein